MALFRRKNKSSNGNEGEEGTKKEKGQWKKPANTAFKQQRLKAWQPILTPKIVLSTLYIIGILFAPIGGLLIWGSSKVSQITIDYTQCDTAAPTNGAFSSVNHFTYNMRSSVAKKQPDSPPSWSFVSDPTNADPTQRARCTLQFEVPSDMGHPVFIYYKLTSFYQNHRRYVKSMDTNQLKGKFVSASTLNGGDCKPLAISSDGRPIYPCGLVANSLFNDTIGNPVLIGSTNQTYQFSSSNIAWPGEAKKYSATPGYPNLTDIVPPPNWALRFPDGYTAANPPPNLKEDEHFQNWMRTAGLPTFSKLWGRNDSQTLAAGTYQLVIAMNFPVSSYGGTKSIIISTVSWIGGKNPFLGWAYIGAAALFLVLAVLGTIRHIIKPRKLGDMTLLSWNQPPAAPR